MFVMDPVLFLVFWVLNILLNVHELLFLYIIIVKNEFQFLIVIFLVIIVVHDWSIMYT